MLQNLKKRSEGFTIVEVMIVLAIAGLILLIVFLAVPALQRNSRNTSRRNDISSLLGAYAEEFNNNSATVPASCNGATPNCFVKNIKLSSYDNASATNVTFTNHTAAAAPAPPAVAEVDRVYIHNYSKCAGNASTAAGASQRSIIALFRVETQGGSTVQCQES